MNFDLLDSTTGILASALLIGLLIGVERGWQSRDKAPGHRVAGIRTFGLIGLLGGVAGLLAKSGWGGAAGLVMAAAAFSIAIGYWRAAAPPESLSVTSTVAALLTLGLGMLTSSGFALQAIATACVVTLFLASRSQLHGWLSGLSETDVQATARFALIAAAIWPLLPNQSFGPYDAWNARTLWAVVVLVTGFSLAGYVANKKFGQNRGTLATSAIGGMYSSTAVIAALSTRLRGSPGQIAPITAGIALASAVMFGRVLILTAILAPAALPTLALATGPAAAVALLLAIQSARRPGATAETEAPEPSPRNPVELLPALGFALLVAATAVATRWAEQRFGGAGAGVMIVITGSFDVDAAIVTLGGLSPRTFSPHDAGLILAAPVLVNTLFKAAIVIANGGSGTRWRAATPLLLSAATLVLAAAALLLL
jgi:uncharacterized membrane protein (DUF4010 family)